MEIDLASYTRQPPPRDAQIAKIAARRADPTWFFVLLGVVWFPLAATFALAVADSLKSQSEWLVFWALFSVVGASFFFRAAERRARWSRFFREGQLVTGALKVEYIGQFPAGGPWGWVEIRHGAHKLRARGPLPSDMDSCPVLFDPSNNQGSLIVGGRVVQSFKFVLY